MSQIRVKDYTGKVIHKKKRGFTTKKEALEWERDFLNKATADMGMLFQDFVELYFEDMSHRLKESTIISKHYMVDKKILPVYGKIPINEITPKDIRKWQNSLTAYRDENGKLFGDVDRDFDDEPYIFVTPVPGGVGLMTRACLVENVIEAYKNRI